METSRKIPVKRVIASFIIATIIFISGFLVSNYIANSKYHEIQNSEENLKYSLMEIEAQKNLALSDCNLFNPFRFSSDLDNMGSTLSILEQRFGKHDERILNQKNIYSVLETQHFLLLRDYQKNCNNNISIILFFYSNQEEFEDYAERIGYILDSAKSENVNLMIYSFDYELESDLIELLKKKYQIESPNTIIINEKNKITDLKNIDELSEYLKK